MAAPLRRIVVATDFDETSREALDVALMLAGSLGASVEVVHAYYRPVRADAVVLAPGLPTRSVSDILRAEAAARMNDFIQPYHGKEMPGSRLVEGDPRDVLVTMSENADLLVLGTHGRRGIARALLGSVAEYLVRRAACPVLTLRAKSVPSPVATPPIP